MTKDECIKLIYEKLQKINNPKVLYYYLLLLNEEESS